MELDGEIPGVSLGEVLEEGLAEAEILEDGLTLAEIEELGEGEVAV